MAAEDFSSLLYTPTWAVAAVCAIFVVCSLAVERSIFFIGHVLRTRKQAALSEALEKIKEELMVVGFISLALTVGQRSVSHICVPSQWTEFMLQCKKPVEHKGEHSKPTSAEESGLPKQACVLEGEAPLITLEGLHQLHILLFVLAIVHVIYSVIIMGLGMIKVHQWRAWEERSNMAETFSAHGQIRYTRDVTFIRRHVGVWSRNTVLAFVAAFFQQFFQSVSETDYLTLRHGFVTEHMLKSFDFHKYIVKSLEDDFKDVVGISPPLWGYTILLTLLNVDGWGMFFWASSVPLIMVLTIGTKLRHIITQMAVQYSEKHAVVEGMPDVKPTDEHFWFGNPRFILYLIHLTLFQDALQLSLHLWNMYAFPKGNCFYRHRYLLLGRLLLGVLAQLICGYVILPIYALVSQMGSQMKGDGGGNDHIEMTSLRLHGEETQNPSRVVSLKGAARMHIAADSDPIHQLHCVGSKLQCPEGSKLEEQGGGDSTIEEIKEDNGQGDVLPLQTKMSFIQRAAWSIQGGDYHSLVVPLPK